MKTLKLVIVKRRKVALTERDYTVPLFVLKEKKRIIRIRRIPIIERLITQERATYKTN